MKSRADNTSRHIRLLVPKRKALAGVCPLPSHPIRTLTTDLLVPKLTALAGVHPLLGHPIRTLTDDHLREVLDALPAMLESGNTVHDIPETETHVAGMTSSQSTLIAHSAKLIKAKTSKAIGLINQANAVLP